MDFKIVLNGPVYIEAVAHSEEERKNIVKGIIYTMKDLTEANIINVPQTLVYEAENEENRHIDEPETMKPVEYASDGQRRYMTKLGIPFTETTTKIEAIDLINEWKVAHGVPVNGK